MPGTPKEYAADKEGSFDPLCFFANKAHKLYAIVGRHGALSIPVNAVLDTGAKLNLIRKKRIDSAWHYYIRPVQRPRLLDAHKLLMKSGGLNYLIVRIGEFRAGVSFFVIQNLAVDCLLGKPYIDHFLKAILPGLRKLLLSYSLSVAITDQRSSTMPIPSLTLKLKARSRNILPTRKLTGPSMS